jgi:hypothetical protein
MVFGICDYLFNFCFLATWDVVTIGREAEVGVAR